MEKKSARKNESSENESDDADRSSDLTQEEGATDSQSEEPDSQVGNVRKAGQSGSVRASAVGGTPSGQKSGSHSSGGGYVNYERGSDPGTLSARYGMDVREAEAGKLQRLEREFGRERVSRWAEEGMPVETMGKPHDMEAFRKRQENRSEEIPTDIERWNEASLQRNAAREREEGPAGEAGVPDVVRSVVSSPGRSMEESVQREMESKMGGDFSDVQVHTGPKAAAAADSINARAFTVGNHVAFNEGEYRPESTDGKKILAHELTHVRQQTEGAVSMLPKADADSGSETDGGMVETVAPEMHVQPKLEVSSPDDPAEKEAERVAERVVEMGEPGSKGKTEDNSETSSVNTINRATTARAATEFTLGPEVGFGDGTVHLHRKTGPGKVLEDIRTMGIGRQVQREATGEVTWENLILREANLWQVFFQKAKDAVTSVQGYLTSGGGGGPSIGGIALGAFIGALGFASALVGAMEMAVASVVLAGTGFAVELTKTILQKAVGGTSGQIKAAKFLGNLRDYFGGLANALEIDTKTEIENTAPTKPALDILFKPYLDEKTRKTLDKQAVSKYIENFRTRIEGNNKAMRTEWERMILTGWLGASNKGDANVYYEHYQYPATGGGHTFEFGDDPQIPGITLPGKTKDALEDAWGKSTEVTWLGIPVKVDLYHNDTFHRETLPPDAERTRTWTQLKYEPNKGWKVTDAGYDGDRTREAVVEEYKEWGTIPTVEQLDLEWF